MLQYLHSSQTTCIHMCICSDNITRLACGCDWYTSVSQTSRPCSLWDTYACVYANISKTVNLASEICTCPVQCHESVYSTTISDAPFSQEFTKMVGRITGVNESFIRDNYVSIQIFYKEMKYQKIEQKEAYSELALMADIGGALGLILGSTLMTLVEILDFMVSASVKECVKKKTCMKNIW